MKRNQILAVLAMCWVILACSIGDLQAQTQYSIGLQGYTWDHSTIKILLIPQEGESWWNPDFINWTLRGIGVWNDALADFAFRYPNFSYIANLKLVPVLLSSSSSNLDVYVSWIESPMANNSEQVGVTQALLDPRGFFVGCNVTLTTKNGLGFQLSDVEMQNIAEHEFGHVLGLLHCNYTQDIMYPKTGLNFEVQSISTLDAYGIATIFRWMSTSSQFNPTTQDTVPSSANLPPSIDYEFLAISNENLPPQSVFDPILNPIKRVLSTFFDYFLVPERLMFFVLIMIGLIVSMILYRFFKPRKVPKQTPANSLMGN